MKSCLNPLIGQLKEGCTPAKPNLICFGLFCRQNALISANYDFDTKVITDPAKSLMKFALKSLSTCENPSNLLCKIKNYEPL